MPEIDLIDPNKQPQTIASLTAGLRALGLAAGQTVIVHTRMSAIGWVVGGAVAVVQALIDVLGPEGTLMMPTFYASNSEPSEWRNPPMPDSWLETIRQNMPAYDPRVTPTYRMGAVAEMFRTWDGTLRSAHPEASFAARGPHAAHLTADYLQLSPLFDDTCPLGKLYTLDGMILLLGVDHFNNSSLHLAEARANIPREIVPAGTAMLVDGVRQWVRYDLEAPSDADFVQLGNEFEAAHPELVQLGHVGYAPARLMRQRPLVDYATAWLERARNAPPAAPDA
jgi:aminoglycoside 3-N-acetyltransferase